MDVLISVLALSLIFATLVPTQVYAYTLIEFAVADKPTQYQNVTYTVEDKRLGEEYEWLQFYDYYCCNVEHAKLPYGVYIAWDDPLVRAQGDGFDPLRALDDDGGLLTVINWTLEPGTPVEMCISYDNNQNLTKCERTAVAKEEWGGYSFLIIEIDMDAEDV